ncbi:hypothetical protein GQ600_25104 [Phytophthora cactorum]|nr:hypothetical protein GQ600_25104 [Phytophthora cactorum]
MSPNGSDDTSQRRNRHNVQDTDVHGLNVAAYPFELFEGTHSDSGASDAPGRGSRNSSASSERLDRSLKAWRSNKPNFIKARARRMRVGSLDTLMRTATQATPAPEIATPQTETTTNMQQPMNAPTAEQFMPPPNFGLKVPKHDYLRCQGGVRTSPLKSVVAEPSSSSTIPATLPCVISASISKATVSATVTLVRVLITVLRRNNATTTWALATLVLPAVPLVFVDLCSATAALVAASMACKAANGSIPLFTNPLTVAITSNGWPSKSYRGGLSLLSPIFNPTDPPDPSRMPYQRHPCRAHHSSGASVPPVPSCSPRRTSRSSQWQS